MARIGSWLLAAARRNAKVLQTDLIAFKGDKECIDRSRELVDWWYWLSVDEMWMIGQGIADLAS